MPFRWKKKTRCNRFSQLVADHLQSPKHGGSLVVETGFPTSLIDLYVRNRGRFRKSVSKKPTEIDSPIPSPSPSPSPSSSGLLVDSVNLSASSSSSSLLVDSNNLSFSALDHREIDEIIEEDVVVVGDSEIKIENSSKIEVEVEKSDELVKLNPVLVVFFKVLLMLILALGTKRFTVGITVSAFFLFFLEMVGKPLLVRSSSVTHSVDSKRPIESKLKQNTTPVVCSEVLSEIEEQVEPKQEVRSEKESDEVKNDVSISIEISHKSSRKAIMKSKMKKLVPKKLRRSSMGSKDDLSCEFKDVRPLVSATKCSDLKGETFCILKQEQDKIVEIEKQSSSSTFSSKIDCNFKESGMESKQNSGYLVLCLIVLVGLIGGRFLAIVLALSWCVMLKKSPKWSNVKFSNS